MLTFVSRLGLSLCSSHSNSVQENDVKCSAFLKLVSFLALPFRIEVSAIACAYRLDRGAIFKENKINFQPSLAAKRGPKK